MWGSEEIKKLQSWVTGNEGHEMSDGFLWKTMVGGEAARLTDVGKWANNEHDYIEKKKKWKWNGGEEMTDGENK